MTVLAAVNADNSAISMSSADGSAWSSHAISSGTLYTSVCWSPELALFAAVSRSGATNPVSTSPDGITWTARTPAEVNAWQSICWSPELGLFCAVSSSGTNRVMTSPDGVTWTARAHSLATAFAGIAWGAGVFVAVGGTTASCMTSPDGINWTTRTMNGAGANWTDVCWSETLGIFLAVKVGSTSGAYQTSPDGITWTNRNPGVSFGDPKCVYSEDLGLFVTVGNSTTTLSSADGATWTPHTTVIDNNTWTDVCWSKELGLFVAVANTGTNRVATSADGTSAWAMHAASAAQAWSSVASSEAGNVSGSGDLATDTATVDGAGLSLSTGIGDLVAGDSTVDGSAASEGTGVLISDSAVISGSGLVQDAPPPTIQVIVICQS